PPEGEVRHHDRAAHDHEVPQGAQHPVVDAAQGVLSGARSGSTAETRRHTEEENWREGFLPLPFSSARLRALRVSAVLPRTLRFPRTFPPRRRSPRVAQFARPWNSPVSVATLTLSPTVMWIGALILSPVSSVTSFFTPEVVLPLTASSASVTS